MGRGLAISFTFNPFSLKIGVLVIKRKGEVMNKELIEKKSDEAISFYENIQKDIEKELKQYL